MTVLDQSINQTLSRTIMTKVVTLIVVVALYALGGPVLQRLLGKALIIGILAGTYSSIYISSAVALDCGLEGRACAAGPSAARQADRRQALRVTPLRAHTCSHPRRTGLRWAS